MPKKMILYNGSVRQNNGGVVIDFSKSKLDIIRAASMVVDSATRRSKKAIIIIVRKKDEFKVFQT